MTIKRINHIRYFLTLLTLTIMLLGISACGFQLRGQNALPKSLHVLYFQTENQYGSLESMLRHTLRSSGVVLVNSAHAAPITLQLSTPVQTNNNATVGPSSRTRVYTLSYQVTFTLKNAQGKILVGPRTLATSRNLTLSANQLPQSNNQIDILSREMERDIVNQLYNVLCSKQVIQTISNPR